MAETVSNSGAAGFEIRVPATTANLGPGFDTLGLAFSLYLTLKVRLGESLQNTLLIHDTYSELERVLSNPKQCAAFTDSVTLAYEGENSADLPTDPTQNLITKTAWYVLRAHGYLKFPRKIHVTVANAIPLGRGLGSSGSAVVAGVLLANAAANLRLTQARLLDFALAIERHPDNVSAALLGGFVASYLMDDSMASHTRALEETFQPSDQGNSATDAYAPSAIAPRMPPSNTSRYVQLAWASEIRAVAVIPQFQLSTAKARAALPQNYSRGDLVFNLQRVAVLTHALGQSPPDAVLISEAMRDQVHQPYRTGLIPGLQQLLDEFVPEEVPGVLGTCLSGAGPTVIILATANWDTIAQKARQTFALNGVEAKAMVLEVAHDGACCVDKAPVA
ncbi:Trihydroxynaphthalene reductase [Tieghemiomyces parasiticus]|uniref:Homoserine kinase n=1 Tax=Tieghemiomyces parasiticus TaxID=78921 RepID=A0A9W8DXK4_9FUNG|nr:Trihydroxynaphthalene reductase [Tieghemiomyces parasiticus]